MAYGHIFPHRLFPVQRSIYQIFQRDLVAIGVGVISYKFEDHIINIQNYTNTSKSDFPAAHFGHKFVSLKKPWVAGHAYWQFLLVMLDIFVTPYPCLFYGQSTEFIPTNHLHLGFSLYLKRVIHLPSVASWMKCKSPCFLYAMQLLWIMILVIFIISIFETMYIAL